VKSPGASWWRRGRTGSSVDRLLGLLMEKNQEWAKHAGVLAISTGKKTFSHNGAPNRFGIHDVGTAFGQLSLQAVAMGLHVHGMGGFDAARTRTEFAIRTISRWGRAFAIGYLDGDGGASRRAEAETALGDRFQQGLGEPAAL